MKSTANREDDRYIKRMFFYFQRDPSAAFRQCIGPPGPDFLVRIAKPSIRRLFVKRDPSSTIQWGLANRSLRHCQERSSFSPRRDVAVMSKCESKLIIDAKGYYRQGEILNMLGSRSCRVILSLEVT